MNEPQNQSISSKKSEKSQSSGQERSDDPTTLEHQDFHSVDSEQPARKRSSSGAERISQTDGEAPEEA